MLLIDFRHVITQMVLPFEYHTVFIISHLKSSKADINRMLTVLYVWPWIIYNVQGSVLTLLGPGPFCHMTILTQNADSPAAAAAVAAAVAVFSVPSKARLSSHINDCSLSSFPTLPKNTSPCLMRTYLTPAFYMNRQLLQT